MSNHTSAQGFSNIYASFSRASYFARAQLFRDNFAPSCRPLLRQSGSCSRGTAVMFSGAMFVSPFTLSLGCDAAIVVIYLQRPLVFGGTPWFSILPDRTFSSEIVDIAWLAILRILFLLPHVLPFLKRRRLSCPSFQKSFVLANAALVLAKAVIVIVDPAPHLSNFLWWTLLILSAFSVIAQWGCLYHLRSSMPTPRYKTIFIGSRLNARLLGDQYGAGVPDMEDEGGFGSEDLEAGGGNVDAGVEETKEGDSENKGLSRKWRRGARAERSPILGGNSVYRSRQDSTRELVDYFADRMQEARDAWGTRVQALQKRWQASFLRGDWGVRGGRSASADRDAALRLTFGLVVRMYAYEDTLNDLRITATQDPYCLEAFAPQFVSFLVWDSYYMSGQLEAWLLARCSENLYFAHALEFSLRASCLPPSSIGGGGARSGEGGRDIPLGGSTADEVYAERGSEGETVGGSSGGGGGGGGGGGNEVIDKVGRRAIELLLGEIAEEGERAARRLVEASRSSGQDQGQGPGHVDYRSGGSASVAEAEAETTEAKGSRGGGGGGGNVALYRQTVDFMTRLANIAASLTPLSKDERTPSLRKQLTDVGKEFLSGVSVSAGEDRGGGEGGEGLKSKERLVYVPIGDRHHRVVALHPSDSFAFSTKERAPCFICLEVVGAKEPARGFSRDERDDAGALADADVIGSDVNVRAGVGSVLWGRARALRQWLPRTVKFKRAFRFPGGREWMLSLWKVGDGDEDDQGNGADGDMEAEGIAAGAGAGTSVSSQDLRQGEAYRSVEMEIGPRRGARREGSDNDNDDYYRLLMEERVGGGGVGGREGSGSRLPMSDAMEWWAEGSAGKRAWGRGDEEDDHYRDYDEEEKEAGRLGGSSTVETGGGGVGGEGERPSRPTTDEDFDECGAGAAAVAGGGKDVRVGEATQPNVLFNELWRDKSDIIRRVSPWANEPGWRLLPVIVKSNDDLRQEQLASQLLYTMQRILRAERIKVWLRPYDIVALSADTGIIEAVPDTISLDALRRYKGRGGGGSGGAAGGYGDASSSGFSLTGFFEARFGNKGTEGFRKAQRRFIESLAAYSIACYLLQIKDRHNGNILLNAQGRLIHVDFGFMLANSPGGNLGFESAPFKLTQSFINLMGGTRSRCFRDFRRLCVDTFLALRRNSQEIVLLVEMMASGNETLPCFQGSGGGAAAAADLAARFKPDLNDPACEEFVHKLVQQSVGSWTTAWYDKYQRFWVGIY